MSLEQAIEKNTAAVVALTAALLAKSAPAAPAAAPKAPQATTPKPTPTLVTPPAAAAPELTYKDVAKVVSDFVKANGRRPAELLLEPFGVKTLVPLQDKPTELAGAYAAFTDPAKTAAAIAAAPIVA